MAIAEEEPLVDKTLSHFTVTRTSYLTLGSFRVHVERPLPMNCSKEGYAFLSCSRVAFCAWLISNVLFSMPVPVYGGYMVLVTGAFLIFALLSFSTVRNAAVCLIKFGEASLQPVYGASFWLTLATGEEFFYHTFLLRRSEQGVWSPPNSLAR